MAYLKRALALLPTDDPRRAELLCRIGTESAIPYGGDQELEFLRQGLDLAQRIGDHKTIARALLSMSRAMSARGQGAEATCFANATLAHAEAIGDQETRGRALIHLGSQAYYRKEHAQALQYLEESLAIFENLDSSQEQDISFTMARALNNMGMTCLALGDFEAAARHWYRALNLVKKMVSVPSWPCWSITWPG